MLSSEQVAAMRAAAERALPDTATIRRRQRVTDGAGGWTEQWTDLATVACRIAPLGGGELTRQGSQGGRIADETTHVVTLPAATDVTEADQLEIAGQAYAVTAVRTRGAWEITRRVECREVV